ncbi:type II toxin-antitoxin system VapC family toxin [Amycolatopsis eburnea]|uniref:type II toxin-antitoxin system VapC family toxin n=1 Tax=Amycolatopsis eburnea TaxID=2267691 RepID=UPI0017838CDD|nr:type II toxin-antitoxin system VapC family toxin [Amycolatopsis eburnea]
MADQRDAGVLDTCVYIDLNLLEPAQLPKVTELTAISMAELHQGVVVAKDSALRASRTEKLGAAITDFSPLPFDGDAATRYGTFVAMVLATGRDPRPRKMDLMIAAIASVRGLPLYTRNAKDFRGLESLLEVVEV